MDVKKNYYGILGVEKNATREQIKAAYRKLSMRYHPDRNQDDPAAEEKMKAINEAYEILDSDINRLIYDEYKKKEEQLKKEEAEAEKKNNKKTNGTPNKKVYTRKTVIRTERRVYVKGTITVKYWAEQEEAADLFIMKEMSYRLNPVYAEAIITHSEIHEQNAPADFLKAFKETDIFKTAIPNPVKCKIVAGNKEEEWYDLHLQELKLVDPVLTDIVKFEKQSLGTLKGAFYAYVLRIDEKEEEETVTECEGETGQVERKVEEGKEWYRKEFYHRDCSTYWGPWVAIEQRKTATTSRNGTAVKTGAYTTTEGCAQYWWIGVLLILLLFWPQLFLGLLVMAVVGGLFSLGIGVLGRYVPLLWLLFAGLLIYAAVKPSDKRNTNVKTRNSPTREPVISTTEPVVKNNNETIDSTRPPDTLINHFIRWKDYDSVSYAMNLAVTAGDLQKSKNEHSQIELNGWNRSIAQVYQRLENTDQAKLERIYQAFDSVKKQNKLGVTDFAKMLVTCIQSMPYYLVLDNACKAEYAKDEFTYSFLRQCQTECCVGNTRYGVRSPVEFISDLKGDCDTRALFIYSVLKKFNYDVALLTSQYYKHAVIAVHFGKEENGRGIAMNINNRNYYLWETTSPGFQPGQMPEGNRNLDYWDIALLNEKK
jgi:curved DNA-binding protein CbpA